MNPLLTFRLLDSAEEATAIVTLLNAHQIPTEVENETPLLDATIIGQQFGPKVRIKIPAEDFSTANELLKRSVDVDLDQVEPDYYLLSFSDLELLDVVRHEDQWGVYDYKLATLLLNKRGINIDEEDLEKMQETRIEQLSKPIIPDPFWIALGYFLALISGAGFLFRYGALQILVAALGITTGVVFAWGRKTLSNGTRVYIFDNSTRNHGVRMLFLGIIMLVIWTVVIYRVVLL